MPMVHIDIDSEANDEAKRVVSNAYDGDEWCEPGSIRHNIKDLTGNIDRHAESLHNMFEAINAVSQMTAHQKEWIDKLEERIKVLEK